MREYVGPPLTRDSLGQLLDREGIRPDAYSLYGSHKPEAIVLDRRPTGWVVFYTERGSESNLRRHVDEAEACFDLLNRIFEDEHNRFALVAGPAPPGQADSQFQQWLTEHGLTVSDLDSRDWMFQDSPWRAGEPDYRRYWIRITRIRAMP